VTKNKGRSFEEKHLRRGRKDDTFGGGAERKTKREEIQGEAINPQPCKKTRRAKCKAFQVDVVGQKIKREVGG